MLVLKGADGSAAAAKRVVEAATLFLGGSACEFVSVHSLRLRILFLANTNLCASCSPDRRTSDGVGGCCCFIDALVVLMNDGDVVHRSRNASREGGGSLKLAVLNDHNAKTRAC